MEKKVSPVGQKTQYGPPLRLKKRTHRHLQALAVLRGKSMGGLADEWVEQGIRDAIRDGLLTPAILKRIEQEQA